MDVETFAAQRRESLKTGDDAIRPAVVEASHRRNNGEAAWWAPIVTAASQVWLENHQAEAPGAGYQAALARFRESMAESLAQTGDATNVERITRWASTLAVNAGTISGAARAGVGYKIWLTMDDDKVRDIHRPLDGKIVRMGATFDVAGSKLPYPAVPVGPPEVWIECRCVAMPASREGEAMTSNTFAIGPDDEVDDNEDIVLGYDIASGGWAAPSEVDLAVDDEVPVANPDGTPYTGALVVLLPAKDDPIVAASSEPAHLTTVWFGEATDLPVDVDELEQAVRLYAQDLDGPVVVPVAERGTLGDDDADVVHLEATDALTALRDGLLANEPVKAAYDAAEQFPTWQPHVTLGYPDRPARGEYDATEVTFDRVGLWLGGEHTDYPMGGTVSDTITADASSVSEIDDQSDLTDAPTEVAPEIDEPDAEEDAPNEIPIHGVLAPEGVETGDGRGFRPGALSTRTLPIPFRTEVVSSHGGNNTSEVVDAGRIDEAWLDEPSQMWRFRGALVLSSPGGPAALEGIITGVRRGVSIDADMMADDVETYTDEYVQAAMSEGKNPTRWFKSTRVAGLTHVPIPAFEEAYVGLGHEFEEDMTDEDREAAIDALTACGCLDGIEIESLQSLVAFKDYDAAARKRMAGNGQAMPDGSFPIADEEDLRNAIQSVGRAADQDAARAHIKKRARALGKTALLPEDWASIADGGLVAAGTLAFVGEDGPEVVAPLDTFVPGTHDGPGWITNPVATSRIRRYWVSGKGAAKIRWGQPGDFNRCRAQLAKYVQNPEWLAGLCANMHYEALKFWPATHAGKDRHALIAAGGIPAPIATLVAAGGESFRFPAEYFADPGFTGVTPLTIDKATRRVYGHLAQWKSCHIGVNGVCQKPPRSGSHYANFLKGVIDTDAGEQLVGTLTYGIGHANPMLRAAAATAHYDQTDAVFAFVNVGEDAHGIWYSGVLRAGVADDVIDDIRAIGALSGDWRRFPRYGLDLVAAVSVNTPGYSLAASAGEAWEGHGDLQMSALGLGIVEPEIEHGGETHEQFVARVAEQVRAQFRREQRVEALHARTRSLRLADAQARIERIH